MSPTNYPLWPAYLAQFPLLHRSDFLSGPYPRRSIVYFRSTSFHRPFARQRGLHRSSLCVAEYLPDVKECETRESAPLEQIGNTGNGVSRSRHMSSRPKNWRMTALENNRSDRENRRAGTASKRRTTGKGRRRVDNEPLDPILAPGPRGMPVVGNALDMVGRGLNDVMLMYAQRHGPFVRFRIVNDVMFLVSDPCTVAWINQENAKNYLDRWTPPGFKDLLYRDRLRGLVFSQSKYWMMHRKVAGEGLRGSRFLETFVDKAVDRASFMLESLWRKRIGRQLNVHQEMRMLTLDIIGLGAFGKDFGAMSSGGAHEIEQRLSNVLHSILAIAKTPVPLWRYFKTSARVSVENDVARLGEIELEIIAERRAKLKNGSAPETDDLLGLLLKAADSTKSSLFTDEDIRWDVHDIIFAGHETTASALAAALFLIAGDARVQKKIREELEAVLPGGRRPHYRDLEKLEYLGMLLSEALRLYPPTALIGRIAKDSDVIHGYHIPAKSSILISPYVMGRLESLWDSPQEFRPERFSRENSAKRHPMTHTPFGAGPRACLGAHVAMTEAKVVLAMIMQRYRFERTTDQLDVEYDSTVSFKSGMDMILRSAYPLTFTSS